MNIRRRLAPAVLLLTVTALVAGCSSATKAGSPSSSGAADVSSGPAINVGMICSCTGSQSAALGKSGDVANAWAKSVNDAGGINGVHVKMFVKDDGVNPATALQAAKALVEQDHVVAIVGDMSVVDTAWADYVASKGVPVVGGEPLFPPFATNADFYPSGGSLAVEIYSSILVGKQSGASKLGFLYCAESPVCANLAKPANAYAQSLGMGFTSSKVSATAPDYTAVCLNLKNNGADALAILDGAPVVQRITAGCASQGYKPRIIQSTGAASTDWLKDPNFQDSVLTSVNANYTDESIPGVKAFLDAVDKYAPGLRNSSQFSYPMMWMWAAGKLFEAAAKAGKVTASSSAADVKKGLYALKNETLDGIAPGLTFTQGQPAFIPCYFVIKLQDQKFVTSGASTCLSSDAQATIKGAGVF